MPINYTHFVLILFLEPIADSADGLDVFSTFTELLAQADDLDVDGAVGDCVAFTMDRIDDLRAGEDPSWSLGQQGKRAVGAIPTLIEQVGSEEQYVGYMAARALGEIAKEVLGEARSFGFSPTMTLEERRAIRKQWREWWEANREKLSAD